MQWARRLLQWNEAVVVKADSLVSTSILAARQYELCMYATAADDVPVVKIDLPLCYADGVWDKDQCPSAEDVWQLGVMGFGTIDAAILRAVEDQHFTNKFPDGSWGCPVADASPGSHLADPEYAPSIGANTNSDPKSAFHSNSNSDPNSDSDCQLMRFPWPAIFGGQPLVQPESTGAPLNANTPAVWSTGSLGGVFVGFWPPVN